MSDSNEKEAKRVRFYIKNDAHIRFKASLEKHQLTMSEFLRACCQAISEDNPLMLDYVNHYKETSEKHSKRNNDIIKRDKQKGDALLEEFGIGDEDIQNLFDLIADQHPEI
jgi:hypothetical protein